MCCARTRNGSLDAIRRVWPTPLPTIGGGPFSGADGRPGVKERALHLTSSQEQETAVAVAGLQAQTKGLAASDS